MKVCTASECLYDEPFCPNCGFYREKQPMNLIERMEYCRKQPSCEKCKERACGVSPE